MQFGRAKKINLLIDCGFMLLQRFRMQKRHLLLKAGAVFSSFKALINGVAISTKRKIPFCHRHYFTFSKILPWQMKSTFVMSKYFFISYHFEFCTHACKIQFCFKNSRSTSSGRGVWFGYFSRSGAAAPSIM